MAMPKFKQMQTLVDRMNLVSREILTGIPVIRAFSREKFEEKPFEKANRDLMQTQLFTNRVILLASADGDADHECHYGSDCVVWGKGGRPWKPSGW